METPRLGDVLLSCVGNKEIRVWERQMAVGGRETWVRIAWCDTFMGERRLHYGDGKHSDPAPTFTPARMWKHMGDAEEAFNRHFQAVLGPRGRVLLEYSDGSVRLAPWCMAARAANQPA